MARRRNRRPVGQGAAWHARLALALALSALMVVDQCFGSVDGLRAVRQAFAEETVASQEAAGTGSGESTGSGETGSSESAGKSETGKDETGTGSGQEGDGTGSGQSGDAGASDTTGDAGNQSGTAGSAGQKLEGSDSTDVGAGSDGSGEKATEGDQQAQGKQNFLSVTLMDVGGADTTSVTGTLKEVYWNPQPTDENYTDGNIRIPGGNDANDGTSWEKPVLTFARAQELATQGATVHLMRLSTVSDNTTIDGGGKNLTIDRWAGTSQVKAYPGEYFTVSDGVTLTLRDVSLKVGTNTVDGATQDDPSVRQLTLSGASSLLKVEDKTTINGTTYLGAAGAHMELSGDPQETYRVAFEDRDSFDYATVVAAPKAADPAAVQDKV